MNLQTFETWLPLFPGFYGTHFELDESNFIHSENQDREYDNRPLIDYDDLIVDYTGYQNKVVELCTDFVESQLKDIKIVHSINFQSISSPKYYNFSNDSGNIEVLLNKSNIKNIQKYLRVNEIQWAKYVRDHYTSRDGFNSWHSNQIQDWKEETQGYTNFSDSHKLGAILQFIISNELPDAYESMIDYVYNYGSLDYEFISIKDSEGQLLLNEIAGRNFLPDWINFEASQLPESNSDKNIFIALSKAMNQDDIELIEWDHNINAHEFIQMVLDKYKNQTLTPEEAQNNLKLAL